MAAAAATSELGAGRGRGPLGEGVELEDEAKEERHATGVARVSSATRAPLVQHAAATALLKMGRTLTKKSRKMSSRLIAVVVVRLRCRPASKLHCPPGPKPTVSGRRRPSRPHKGTTIYCGER